MLEIPKISAKISEKGENVASSRSVNNTKSL